MRHLNTGHDVASKCPPATLAGSGSWPRERRLKAASQRASAVLALPAARELAQVDHADNQQGLLDLRHPVCVATVGHSSLRPLAERCSATDSLVGEDVRSSRNSLATEPRHCSELMRLVGRVAVLSRSLSFCPSIMSRQWPRALSWPCWPACRSTVCRNVTCYSEYCYQLDQYYRTNASRTKIPTIQARGRAAFRLTLHAGAECDIVDGLKSGVST